MNRPRTTIRFAPELDLFVSHERRRTTSGLVTDGTSSLGHVVESLGVPLTEAGALLADGREVDRAHVPADGEQLEVRPVTRPQPAPGAPLRFLLDVHLGTLARRLRLLGVDASYTAEDPGDAALAKQSAAEHRVLLTRDRGLLRRRELWLGAYIYSDNPAEQLRDVLGRFSPGLRPWTRCTACNGTLRTATKEQVADRLEGGTKGTYDVFAECQDCARVFWRGAHHEQLESIVAAAVREFDRGRPGG